jgi:Cu(I)/Ag(I) efflux system membrane fusion protein
MELLARTLSRLSRTLLLLHIALLLAGCNAATQEPEAPAAAVDSLIHIPAASLASGELVVQPLRALPLADTIVVNGQIQPRPLDLAHVSTRVAGALHRVDAVIGDHVAKGQVLATLYSPEFSAAEGDYLLAQERARTAAGDASEFVRVAQSARQRLELLGAGAEDLDRLDRTREPIPFLLLRSPIAGVVTEVEAGTGKQVPSGTDLFGVVNLRQVWAVVDAYELDLGRLHVGQPASIRATAYPGRSFQGRVVSLEGSIQEATRTLDVRLEVGNPELMLRPGMFVSARIATGVTRDALVIDEDAIQSQGDSKVMYVALTDSTFVVRPVEVRSLGGNRAELLSGVRAGERVATRGGFLLKSQASKSQLGGE